MRRIMDCCIVLLFLGTTLSAVAEERMSVQVREGQLRERPSFLAAVTALVEYGERVTVERVEGPWRHVASGEKAGWIHQSALTRNRVRFEAGEEEDLRTASLDELALAGKGFNQQVETSYRRRRDVTDYTWVDRMAQMGKDADELVRFLRQGDVQPREGEQL